MELVDVPYSAPDIVSLTDALPRDVAIDQVSAQLREGRAVLERVLETENDPGWLFPAGGRLDADAAAVLMSLSALSRTFFVEQSLEGHAEPVVLGCPESSPSITCPVRVNTIDGPIDGHAFDDGIQDRFAELLREGDAPQDIQRLFAELAMIWAELPSIEGRVVLATMPTLWRPTPEQARHLFTGLATAPWISTVTPTQGMRLATERIERDLVAQLPPLPDDPGVAYLGAVADADEVVSMYGEIRPPLERVERLSTNILTAQSRSWWQSDALLARGSEYIDNSIEEAEDELDKIRIGGPDQIILTSQRGRLQLQVFNDTGYPVTLQLSAVATQVDIEEPEVTEYLPGTTPVTMEVSADSSGIYRVDIGLETPAGDLIAPAKTISVRSTAFNEIAVTLTLGALLFLIIFFVVRFIRRRRPPLEGDAEATPA